MGQFTASVKSAADVSADREAVWKALTDPDLLARLTPLLQSIRADGDLWTWTMIRIAALGVAICPSFTEKMTFDDGQRIDYTHAPPPGTKERAGAEGSYVLADVPGGTHLEMEMTLRVDLPLPRTARPAVQRVMRGTIDRTGQRFWTNLLAHLGATEI
jgi:carbon monoxide dehydrogenase subunit G